MYVKRLIEFSERNSDKFPPIGFAVKKIKWIVDVDETGLIFNEVNPQSFIVPVVTMRTSGVKPSLLVDKPDYVFGMNRKTDRHKAYVELLIEYAGVANDEDVLFLIEQLAKPFELPERLKLSDFIVFRIRGEVYLHKKQAVRDFWSKEVQPEVTEKSFIAHCMFCGEKTILAERHSISFDVSGERPKLISANENAYESQGIKKSLVAPTCYNCEQKYGQALEYLLKKETGKSYGDHMFPIDKLTYVFWLKSEIPFNPYAFLTSTSENPKNIEEMKTQLNQVFSGVEKSYDFNDFCLLVLSANKGRLVVREYVEASMGQIHDRILAYLTAQDIGRNRLYGVYTLAGAIYQNAAKQMRPVDVRDWMDWVFQGRALPGRILTALIRRIQAEGNMFASHAAVLKSWLVSQQDGRLWTVITDKENKNPAYVLGKVFAVLEKIHGEAIGSDDTLSSRFFGSASSAPKSVFGMLIKNSQHHLMKLGREKKGLAVIRDRKLTELLGLIDDFPSTFRLAEQAEFALGYYHQKEELWRKKEDN